MKSKGIAVIAAFVLGGCMSSVQPIQIEPATPETSSLGPTALRPNPYGGGIVLQIEEAPDSWDLNGVGEYAHGASGSFLGYLHIELERKYGALFGGDYSAAKVELEPVSIASARASFDNKVSLVRGGDCNSGDVGYERDGKGIEVWRELNFDCKDGEFNRARVFMFKVDGGYVVLLAFYKDYAEAKVDDLQYWAKRKVTTRWI